MPIEYQMNRLEDGVRRLIDVKSNYEAQVKRQQGWLAAQAMLILGLVLLCAALWGQRCQ